jgi:hypothetical protein
VEKTSLHISASSVTFKKLPPIFKPLAEKGKIRPIWSPWLALSLFAYHVSLAPCRLLLTRQKFNFVPRYGKRRLLSYPLNFQYANSSIAPAAQQTSTGHCSNTCALRAILNFTPGPQGWNLSRRVEVHPFVHPQGWTLFIVYKNGGANREFHPQGITLPLGDKLTPGGQLRPWGSKFAPRGEVKNGPLLCACVSPAYRDMWGFVKKVSPQHPLVRTPQELAFPIAK